MAMPGVRSEFVEKSPRQTSKVLHEWGCRYRTKVLEELATPGNSGTTLARKLAQLADELMVRVFDHARAEGVTMPLLLGAVGGYGRGLLAPGSDLDLCLVTTETSEIVAECVQAILYPLWDAGVQVGHQIVKLAEVANDAEAELTLATELLDFRPLSGDFWLYPLLQEQLNQSIFSRSKIGTFIEQLDQGIHRRHAQYGDSVYLLEPDLKCGTGGLRDFDSALWATRARFGTNDLNELERMNLLTRQSRVESEAAFEFLWTVRCHLHRGVGKRADRLMFAEQERVADAMGYARQSGENQPQLQRIGEMVEAFMSDYYRHARTIARMSAQLLGRAKRGAPDTSRRVTHLGDGFVECDGRVGLAEPDAVRTSVVLAFRIYALAMAREMRLLSRTRDAIFAAAADPEVCEQLRQSDEARGLFVALLCSSQSAPFLGGSVLTELHDVGLLLAMIPEFAPVVGRVHHDMYHVYTVDVHSIAAVDKLHALVRGELANTFPLATRIAGETVRPRVLFMATLLHDVGKAIGGRDHARRGAEMAEVILGRLGFSSDEIEDVSRLVFHHLTMYMVAIRRDLNDPGTIIEFSRAVRDRESLRELFLLTVGDVSTTSSHAMTSWKLSMLDALFRSSDAFLGGNLMGATSRVVQVREKARGLWKNATTLGELDSFLESMPERYFLANKPEEVVAHAELALRSGGEPITLSWMPSSQDGLLGLCVVADATHNLDLFVVADDRPGLLASITAAISASHFDIQAAQINSRRLVCGGYQALDLFWIRSSADERLKDRRLAQLKSNLAAVVRGEVAPEALVGPRLSSTRGSRHTPKVATEVLFDHHASDEYTVIEVLAEDRPALLFILSRTLRELGIVIGVAKVSTEGTRAIDVLYVSESDGTKIAMGERADEVRAKLLDSLGTAAAA